MNLSKLWKIQGLQRLGLNTTSLFSSPVTPQRSCFFLNFSPFPTRYRRDILFHVAVSCKFLTILFTVIASPSCFSPFSISLGVAVSASHDRTSPINYRVGD